MTGLLLAAFVLLILVLPASARPLSGGRQLTVTISTLVTAALFAPFRNASTGRSIAASTAAASTPSGLLAAFSDRRRDQVDIVMSATTCWPRSSGGQASAPACGCGTRASLTEAS